jgi:taurine--2-oxoglutarate transaminase
VLVPPPGYWDEVRAACDRHGTLLVADCVLNGFGRLGTYYGFEAVGAASPDLITISKGLTGGYAPLGAVLVHDRVAKHFEDHVLYAGLTFYGHPLGVAAGLAALDEYEDQHLVARAAVLGSKLAASVASLQDRHPTLVVRSRALGLLAGIELDVDDARWARLERELASRRLLTHPNKRIRTLIVSPPLVISEAELDDGMSRLESALDASS